MSNNLEPINHELLDLMSAVIFTQLAVEKNENLKGTPFWKSQLKPKATGLIKYLEPALQKEYNKAFAADEQVTQSALFQIEKVVEFMGRYRIDQLAFLASMMEAHEINPASVEGIIKKILKK